MSRPWEGNWRPSGGGSFSGGQGKSFLAHSRNDPADTVLIKTLNRPKNSGARKRFRREVPAYETLDFKGLPRLIEHNAIEWRNRSIDLYMVLEYVPGPTLGEKVLADGPFPLEIAQAFISAMSDTIEACHEEGVIHRDLKPANIVLRSGGPTTPVVVDFGLSFNEIDEDMPEVTRVGEEVGNRFLRLPEHTGDRRQPVTDVTLLAGLLFYTLTGIEPRVLLDEDGNKPHQRPGVSVLLDQAGTGQQILRLKSVFDRSFDPRILERFQSVRDFRLALNAALSETVPRDEFSSLLEQLDAVVTQLSHTDMAASQELLQTFTRFAARELQQFASTKPGLTVTQTGGGANVSAAVPFATIQLTLSPPGERNHSFIPYRFEIRGPSDVVLVVEGKEIWRGATPSSDLSEAIQKLAIASFLERVRRPAT